MDIPELPSAGARLSETLIRTDAAPENVFHVFKDMPFSSLLNSSLKTDAGRYSYIGVDPFLTLKSVSRSVTLFGTGVDLCLEADPFEVLSGIISAHKNVTTSAHPFAAGGMGYFSYELKNLLEDLPRKAVDDIKIPEMFFCFYRTIIAFDRMKPGEATAFELRFPGETDAEAKNRTSSLVETVRKAPLSLPPTENRAPGPVRSNFSREKYIAAVSELLEHIKAGDIYQACLTQRFESAWEGDAYGLYSSLNKLNPAPFSAYIDCGDFSIISSSPELFLKVGGGAVETRPMKGTRRRGGTAELDAAMSRELISSEKDAAELLMIVDLERNDLGKVCLPGSIEVSELRRIETYPSVFQTIAVIKGRLKEDVGPVDVLKAAFPGGSISGCPKIRALEILDGLEPTTRGVYTGALGYISFHDTMELNIAIRTMLKKGTKVYFHAGGGIVSDSDPEKEYEETLVKAEVMAASLKLRIEN